MNRHGLTMLEVLIATALLALVVAACLPWLTAAPAKAVDPAFIASVGRCADVWMNEARNDNKDENDELFSPTSETITDPLTSEFRTLTVERFDSDTHHWLIFECEGVRVARCMEPIEEPTP